MVCIFKVAEGIFCIAGDDLGESEGYLVLSI